MRGDIFVENMTEILEWMKNEYPIEYKKILSVLYEVKTKIDDDGKLCFERGEYDKITDLIKWGEKLKAFDYTGIESCNINKTIEKKDCLEQCFELTISDDWENNKPKAVKIQGIRYSAFTWKDILGGVYKLLYDKDPVKFKEIVDNDIISGRKHASLANKKKDSTYKLIGGTGYYYKFRPLSALQVKKYIIQILDVYKIGNDEFSISAISNKKNKMIQSPKENKNITTHDIKDQNLDVVYLVEKPNVCLECKQALYNLQKQYHLYELPNRQGESNLKSTYVKRCRQCNKEYMSKGTYLSIQKGKQDFDNRIDFIIDKKYL